MTRTKLIENIQSLVKSIESEELLQSLYDFLKRHQNAKPGQLWNSLNEAQKEEVLKAAEESEHVENLIPMDQVFKH
jgi:hypothetical protein